jgi:hypothetical protein
MIRILTGIVLFSISAVAQSVTTFKEGVLVEVSLPDDDQALAIPSYTISGYFSKFRQSFKMDDYKKHDSTSWINHRAIGYKISGWLKVEKKGKHSFFSTVSLRKGQPTTSF